MSAASDRARRRRRAGAPTAAARDGARGVSARKPQAAGPARRARHRARRWRAGSATGRFAGMLVAVVVAGVARLPPAAARRASRSARASARPASRSSGSRSRARSAYRRLDVYNVAFDQQSMAMPLVDLDGDARSGCSRFGWIKRGAGLAAAARHAGRSTSSSAQPAAIWQHNQRLSLIDGDGVVLEPVRLEAMPDLPLVIGPDANRHARRARRACSTRRRSLQAAWSPARPGSAAGAGTCASRRGEVLALPEGERGGAPALIQVSPGWTSRTQLLGRGFVRFDMRDPGAFIVRVSREPGAIVPARAPPPDPGQPPQDLARTI